MTNVPLKFFVSLIAPALAAAAAVGVLGSWGLWVVPALVFVVIPLLDAALGDDLANREERFRLLHDLPLFLWLPAQWFCLGVAITYASELWSAPLSFALVAMSVGLSGGLAINVSHELVHRKSKWHRGAGVCLLASVNYMHWGIEHVHGHHRWVATPRDPASSRLGESLYTFWPRTLWGTLKSAWNIEAKRRTARSWKDRRIHYTLITILLWVAVFFVAGVPGLVLFGASSLVAILLLETINYVEHYGLRRTETGEGKYERVRPEHSWNAPQRMSNWFLFNLQRHSDHHYMASKPYESLHHVDSAPQLPAGYSLMLVTALIPPLWKRVMDPRVHSLM